MLTPELAPDQLVMMISWAERSFARQHPDIGFTCSLPDLSEGDRNGLDQQISTGSYKGYKITLSGCQGKPAGSFQVAVEPIAGKGGKAYCIDATQNIRVADDGRASTCLTSGRVERPGLSEMDVVGIDVHSHDTTPKPKD